MLAIQTGLMVYQVFRPLSRRQLMRPTDANRRTALSTVHRLVPVIFARYVAGQ
jgi:hypothetical protein